MKGIIRSIGLDGSGRIKPAAGEQVPKEERDPEREREFSVAAWLPGAGAKARPGAEVEYDPDPDPAHRRRAINVRPAGAAVEQITARRKLEERRARQSRTYARVRAEGELFLNPYNFVRPLPDPIPVPDDVEHALLDRCPPPPHDRVVGLSGRLRCRVKTVSATFVSDSHDVRGKKGEHRTYQSYREFDDAGREVPCIPASTLRGVVRSVFEAVTNSCWQHVAADRRLSRRVAVRGDNRLTPGRVEPSGNGAWVLRVVHDRPVPRYGNEKVRIPDGVEHGSPCRAELQKGWVSAIHAVDDPAAPDAPRGWYFENGNNVTGKKSERFFHPTEDLLSLSKQTLEAYVLLIADYRERHARQEQNDADLRRGSRARNRPPQDSRFLREGATVPQKAEDCEGELVYAVVENGSVTALSPVSIPRILYGRSLRENFPDIEALRPCTEVNGDAAALRLCPACRTFGWVAADATPGAAARAFRSRVRFSSAPFERDALQSTEHTLEILSTPKPTTIRFYLVPKNGEMEKQRREELIDYDSARSELRGRKFYRRRDSAALGGAERTGQNRTLRDHLEPRKQSRPFEIVFQNLAPLELGALLWSLELEPGWAHRLGYGKPLGLGSVEIAVEDAAVFGPDRYEGGEPETPLSRVTMDALRQRFRAGLAAVQGAPFADLPNVADLRAMLREPGPELKVMYPQLPGESQGSFEWFVENRSPRGGHWLDLADGDAGLPRNPAADAHMVRHAD
jgi:hypothetical protein